MYRVRILFETADGAAEKTGTVNIYPGSTFPDVDGPGAAVDAAVSYFDGLGARVLWAHVETGPDLDRRAAAVAYYGDGAVLDAAETLQDLRDRLRSPACPPVLDGEPYVVALWKNVPGKVVARVLDYADQNRGRRTGETVSDGYKAAEILRKHGARSKVRGGRWASPAHRETMLHATGVGK